LIAVIALFVEILNAVAATRYAAVSATVRRTSAAGPQSGVAVLTKINNTVTTVVAGLAADDTTVFNNTSRRIAGFVEVEISGVVAAERTVGQLHTRRAGQARHTFG